MTTKKILRKSPTVEVEVRDLHLIYRIDQKPNDVDVMLLGRTLSALGAVITESVRALETEERELLVSVRPFEEGSFIMDLVLEMKQEANLLLVLGQSEFISQVRTALEVLGLIKKAKEAGSNLLDLVKSLGGKKPKQVTKQQNEFRYEAEDGKVVAVSPAVNNLYNNGVIHQHFYPALGAAFEGGRADGVETYVKGDRDRSIVKINKTDAASLKEYSEPQIPIVKERVIRNQLTQMLRPKSGNYGEHQGLWTFTRAGSKGTLKAKIVDERFLKSYTRGSVRFFQGDMLEARLIETQTIRGDDITIDYEIVEVIDYQPASSNPSPAIKASARRKRKPTGKLDSNAE